jgi:hypothetical protein
MAPTLCSIRVWTTGQCPATREGQAGTSLCAWRCRCGVEAERPAVLAALAGGAAAAAAEAAAAHPSASLHGTRHGRQCSFRVPPAVYLPSSFLLPYRLRALLSPFRSKDEQPVPNPPFVFCPASPPLACRLRDSLCPL